MVRYRYSTEANLQKLQRDILSEWSSWCFDRYDWQKDMLKSSFHTLLHILTTYADYAIETELCNHPTEIFQCLFAFFLLLCSAERW